MDQISVFYAKIQLNRPYIFFWNSQLLFLFSIIYLPPYIFLGNGKETISAVHGKHGLISIRDPNYKASVWLSVGMFGWLRTTPFSTTSLCASHTLLHVLFQHIMRCSNLSNIGPKGHMPLLSLIKTHLGHISMVQLINRDVVVVLSYT